MKQFNKELHEDIMLLKTLHANKDKTEFNILKAEIMQKHKISKATVYREMKKESPGEYRIPNYNPPKMDIGKQEVLMVRELLIAGRQATEIIKIMGRELGMNYYWDRFNRARQMGEELDENEFDRTRSYFPVKGNMFFEQLLGLEFMGEESYKVINVNGTQLKLTKESLDNIKLEFMKCNPMDGQEIYTEMVLEDLKIQKELEEGLKRKISHMYRSGEVPSAYALRSLSETQDKLEQKKTFLLRAKRTLLKERKKLEEEKAKKLEEDKNAIKIQKAENAAVEMKTDNLQIIS